MTKIVLFMTSFSCSSMTEISVIMLFSISVSGVNARWWPFAALLDRGVVEMPGDQIQKYWQNRKSVVERRFLFVPTISKLRKCKENDIQYLQYEYRKDRGGTRFGIQSQICLALPMQFLHGITELPWAFLNHHLTFHNTQYAPPPTIHYAIPNMVPTGHCPRSYELYCCRRCFLIVEI
jgi:hypothetical protein